MLAGGPAHGRTPYAIAQLKGGVAGLGHGLHMHGSSFSFFALFVQMCVFNIEHIYLLSVSGA